MINNRRSELEIIGKILTLSKNGAKKTELLYQGNFSYTQLGCYLSFLVEKNFIEENKIKNNGNSSKYFKSTDKGNIFLKDINKVIEHLQ